MSAITQFITSINVLVISLVTICENELKIKNVKKFHEFSEEQIKEGNKQLDGEVEIKFVHVSFKYPGTNKNVLNDISFTVKPGEKVALVGMNGSGKSTIIKLLLRFYDVTEGEILYNDISIQEYSRTSIRNYFSVMLQNYKNYAFTIEENIKIKEKMGDKNNNTQKNQENERYRKAINYSGFEKIINNQKHRDMTYVTRLFEKEGVEFSIGQYQKLALARTLYQKAGTILLDEPSAALDTKAEYELLEAIDKCYEGKSIIFITHRLEHISFVEKIFYLENGKLIEQGSEEELMKKNGKYAELKKILVKND